MDCNSPASKDRNPSKQHPRYQTFSKKGQKSRFKLIYAIDFGEEGNGKMREGERERERLPERRLKRIRIARRGFGRSDPATRSVYSPCPTNPRRSSMRTWEPTIP